MVGCQLVRRSLPIKAGLRDGRISVEHLRNLPLREFKRRCFIQSVAGDRQVLVARF